MLLLEIFVPIIIIIIYAAVVIAKRYLRKIKEKKYKGPLLAVLLPSIAVVFICVYQELCPTIIYHTYQESVYLGKVSACDGGIDKVFARNHKAKYRLPHIWKWNEDDEVAIFIENCPDVIKKENIDFWKLDVFLDENGRYASHRKTEYPLWLRFFS